MIRVLLIAEALVFAGAAVLHAGFVIGGYEHAKARTAESVIAAMLLVAVAASVVTVSRLRSIALVAQGLALLGTLIGLFTIAIGVGPRTAVDLVLHAAMVLLLVAGLWLVARPETRSAASPAPRTHRGQRS